MKTSGWAIFDNDKLVEFGSFSIPATKPIEIRLFSFWQKLTELLYDHGEFDKVIFEDIQYQNNAETYRKLAYCQAAIILWCYNQAIKFEILAPSHWRSVIKDKFKVSFGRTRAEQKENAKEFVKNKYNISASEDTCDAICIGLAAVSEKNERAF